MDKYLILYKDCVNVRGAKRHLITDLTRVNNSNFIPDSMSDFIAQCRDTPLEEVIGGLPAEDRVIAEEYVQFILDREFGLVVDSFMKDSLIDFDQNFDTPELIENIIMEIDRFDHGTLKKRLSLLEATLCSAIEIRIHAIEEKDLHSLLTLFDDSMIESIYLHVNDHGFQPSTLEKLLRTHKRVKALHLYNVKEEKTSVSQDIQFECTELQAYCSTAWQKKTFVENQDFYIEGIKHHTYFHKKLYIGQRGEIKNAPEGEEVFGDIDDIRTDEALKAIISSPDFQKLWFVHKALCDVCQDCEFRTMCLDSRLPSQRVDKSWYHKEECSYNPYIAKWKGEEGYQTLAASGHLVMDNHTATL